MRNEEQRTENVLCPSQRKQGNSFGSALVVEYGPIKFNEVVMRIYVDVVLHLSLEVHDIPIPISHAFLFLFLQGPPFLCSDIFNYKLK